MYPPNRIGGVPSAIGRNILPVNDLRARRHASTRTWVPCFHANLGAMKI